jgi:hypothetical protein
MNRYIGTKLIEATPMSLEETKRKLQRDIKPADDNYNGEGYLVKYEDGYLSWSPKEVFEKVYNDTNTCMNFGQAIEMMKLGCKVARKGWNGKGMWITITNGCTLESDKCWNENIKNQAELNKNKSIKINSYIAMKTADGSITIGWSASQTDMLSNDWVIVE